MYLVILLFKIKGYNMKIDNVPFRSLKINIDKRLMNLSNMSKEVNQIKKIFSENNFDKKRNVNVILTHKKGSGFWGIIESKKQGIPYNPNYIHPISTEQSSIKNFKEWLEIWDYGYSQKGLKEWRNIQKKIFKAIKKNNNPAV